MSLGCLDSKCGPGCQGVFVSLQSSYSRILLTAKFWCSAYTYGYLDSQDVGCLDSQDVKCFDSQYIYVHMWGVLSLDSECVAGAFASPQGSSQALLITKILALGVLVSTSLSRRGLLEPGVYLTVYKV
eukprot:1360217-Amorphochlora_amoeboformis.AAC.3